MTAWLLVRARWGWHLASPTLEDVITDTAGLAHLTQGAIVAAAANAAPKGAVGAPENAVCLGKRSVHTPTRRRARICASVRRDRRTGTVGQLACTLTSAGDSRSGRLVLCRAHESSKSAAMGNGDGPMALLGNAKGRRDRIRLSAGLTLSLILTFFHMSPAFSYPVSARHLSTV